MDDYFTSFRREKDGIWICVEPVTIRHPKGRMEVAPGSSFKKGEAYMGVDLATWLDEQLIDLLKTKNPSPVRPLPSDISEAVPNKR